MVFNEDNRPDVTITNRTPARKVKLSQIPMIYPFLYDFIGEGEELFFFGPYGGPFPAETNMALRVKTMAHHPVPYDALVTPVRVKIDVEILGPIEG